MKRLSDIHRITSLDATTPAPRRRAPIIIGAVAAAALIFGGAGAAFAATADPGTTPDGTSSTMERPAHVPHIHGTVVSVSGSTITVTDRDGFTRTIVVTDSTTYGDGLSADLAVGTKIRAAGTVDANGTSLDATKIATAPAGGEHGGQHRGHLGHPGQRPTPPTGAPAPEGSDAPPATPGPTS